MSTQLDKEQLRAAAEKLAADVIQTDAIEAFRRLDAGEYAGTIFATDMSAIRFLLADDFGTAFGHVDRTSSP